MSIQSSGRIQCDITDSPQLWYYPPSATKPPPLKANGSLEVGYGEHGNGASIKLSVPEGMHTDSGFIKVFVSTKYVDMQPIAQPSPLHDANPPSTYGRGAAMAFAGPVGADSDQASWNVSTYILTATTLM